MFESETCCLRVSQVVECFKLFEKLALPGARAERRDSQGNEQFTTRLNVIFNS